MTVLLHRWLDLLFPPHCASCRRRGVWLCPACLATLVTPAPPLCPRCHVSVRVAGLCPACRRHPPAFDSLHAAYQYVGAIRPAIHRFKYAGEPALAERLGHLLVERLTVSDALDLVMPVPLHPDRLRQRGYNQSELLARAVATHLGRPLATELLRARPTRPQVGLDAAERWVNVRGAFAWHGPALVGQRLLLVDDVCTTGATLSACAEALRAAGAARVDAVVLARD